MVIESYSLPIQVAKADTSQAAQMAQQAVDRANREVASTQVQDQAKADQNQVADTKQSEGTEVHPDGRNNPGMYFQQEKKPGEEQAPVVPPDPDGKGTLVDVTA